MDTIVVKLNQPKKAQMLVELLQSMDFVTTVEYFDKYLKAKKLFDEVNNIAAQSELAGMTLADINAEIKAHRDGQ